MFYETNIDKESRRKLKGQLAYCDSVSAIWVDNRKIGYIASSKRTTYNGVKETIYSTYRKNCDYLGSHPSFYSAKRELIEALLSDEEPVGSQISNNDIGRSKREKCAFLPSGENDNFYPTPSHIAGIMLSMVNWKQVETILEPSAGKGDLAQALLRAYPHLAYGNDQPDLDCIEKDANLQYILRGNEYRVIADDFLGFDTKKSYDLILMNPPFDNGDRHLMKALEMQKRGGQIVCLLNANTLKNPYTNLRKLLVFKLQECGAEIKYMENAFVDAERQTKVEIAIVHVNIPTLADGKSELFERMRKAREADMDAQSTPEMLAAGNIFEQMITAFNIEVSASIAFFKEFNAMTPFIQSSNNVKIANPLFGLEFGGRRVDYVDNRELNRYLRKVRLKYWTQLFELPQLTEKFTSNIMEEYGSAVREMADFDFTIFNIRQVINKMNSSLLGSLQETIINLFEKLSCEHSYGSDFGNNIHYYNGWCSNKAHKVNNRVVIPAYGCYADSWMGKGINTYKCKGLLEDIEKCLNYLNPDETDTLSESIDSVLYYADAAKQTRNLHFKYFDASFYKKGTCHLTFTNQKVIDILNIYVARNRNWLPPCYGKKAYNEMTDREQAAVDEFQTKEDYEKVYSDNATYLYETTSSAMHLLTGKTA